MASRYATMPMRMLVARWMSPFFNIFRTSAPPISLFIVRPLIWLRAKCIQFDDAEGLEASNELKMFASLSPSHLERIIAFMLFAGCRLTGCILGAMFQIHKTEGILRSSRIKSSISCSHPNTTWSISLLNASNDRSCLLRVLELRYKGSCNLSLAKGNNSTRRRC